MEGTREIGPSRYSRTDTHVDFQKLRQHVQGLNRSKEDGDPVLTGELDTSTHP